MFSALTSSTRLQGGLLAVLVFPICLPIVKSLGFDPVWFGILMLINLEMAMTTPPFGMLLFVMKGVAPPDVTMRQIYLAAFPFLICDGLALTIVLLIPEIALWLPDIAFAKN